MKITKIRDLYLTFNIQARDSDAWSLYNSLPVTKLLTCNLPANSGGLVDATFTSVIGLEELKKIIQQMTNGSAMMESIKIDND
ncbi:MAG TPA: hypothetical protein VJY62_07140 [Bacteroidia bacterium]|nr:hypothetical protein [Bacteroidia bacterium]